MQTVLGSQAVVEELSWLQWFGRSEEKGPQLPICDHRAALGSENKEMVGTKAAIPGNCPCRDCGETVADG